MAYEPFATINQGRADDALVNENTPLPPEDVETPKGYIPFARTRADFAISQSGIPIEQAAEARRKEALMPKTWFGEMTHGFSRGIDLMQQTAYGLGALGADALNMEGARDFFLKAVEQQNQEIEEAPGRAETFDKVDNFDKFMRYVFSGVGEVAPNIIESVLTGVAGATMGSSVGPEGTIGGGVAGLVGKKAARELIEEGVENLVEKSIAKGVRKELVDFARDRTTVLRQETMDLIQNQSRKIAGKYGATGALGLSSIGQEVGSIYSDLLQDPNIAESDRKVAALAGGFAAGTIEGIFEGFVASKFFKTPKITKAQAEEARNYLVDFTKAYGKEILQTVPGESGTEFAQTVIEEAAKNFADPAKRDAILNFTPEQKAAFIDATFKGAMGGMLGGGIGAVADVRAHPDPQVRIAERKILQDVEDQVPSSALDAEAGPDDTRLSAIITRQSAIEQELAKPDITPEIRTGLEEENARLESEYNTILGEQAVEAAPLVNEKKEEEKKAATIEERQIKFGDETEVSIYPGKSIGGRDVIYVQDNAQKAAGMKGTSVNKPEDVESLVRRMAELRGGIVSDTAAKTEEAAPEPQVKPLEVATEQLKAIADRKLGTYVPSETTETLDEEATSAKFTEIQNLVTENVASSKADEELKKQYVEGVMSAFDVPTVNFLAKEGVVVRKPTRKELKERLGGQTAFAAFDDDKGNIVLTIPDLDGYLKGTVKKAPQESMEIFRRAQGREVGTAKQTVGHEIIHVADLVNIRELFNEDQSGRSFSEFESDYIENRGQILRNAMPALSGLLHGTYYRSLGDATNRELGYEFMRILVEAGRTGKIGEVTDALLRAERAAEGNTQGYISAFLSQWFDAIKRLYAQIQRFFDPKTAPKEIIQQYNELNALLDRYGVLMDDYPVELAQAPVEQVASEETNEAPSEEATPQPAPKKRTRRSPVERAEERLAKTIEKAKAGKVPIVDAMLAHIALQRELDQPVTKANLDENARAFKALYGKGATLKLYKEAAAKEVLVNEKPAAKARPLKPSLASRFEVEMNRGVAVLVDKESGIEMGKVSGYLVGNVFRIKNSYIHPSLKGQGAGVYMYEKLIEDAFSKGQLVVSDNSVSVEAARVYDALARMGYNVIKNEDAILFKEDWMTTNSQPVFYIMGTPQQTPQQIAEALKIRYDGQMMGRLDLYSDTNEDSPSYGTTFSVPAGANFETVERTLAERQEMFQNAPKPDSTQPPFRSGDDRPAAMAKPSMPRRESNKLARAEMEANSERNRAVGEIPLKESIERRVRGEIPVENTSQQELWYDTRPHTRSTAAAQVLVNEMGGALKMAEHLQQDPLGRELTIQEEGDPDNEYGPDAVVSAVYENVLTQMDAIISNLESASADTGTIGYVRELQKDIYESMRRVGNKAGSFNAYRGMNEKLLNGVTARREYVDGLTDNATKILGKDAKKKMSKLSQDLNDLWQKYAGVVTNSPKVISVIRRLHKLVDKSRFEKGYRKTIAKSIERLKAMTKKSAARAADHVSMEEDGEAYVNQAIKRIMLELTPRSKDSRTQELDLVQKVLEQMARGALEDARVPKPKGGKITMQQMMAAIMRNESLYTEFTQQLYAQFVTEYGGVNPSAEFIHHANEIYARLANRMWQVGMVRSLVNEKMQEFNIKFSEIVQDHYNRGQYEVEKIRESISQYMRDNGVENEDLISQLAQDIETEMNGAIEEARERFFTSKSGIRDFLKNMQTTLGDAAKQHSTYIESMEKRFEDELIRLGIPNDPSLPIATTLANAMQKEFNKMVHGERVKIVRRWMESATAEDLKKDEAVVVKRKLDSTVEKILQLANIGAIRVEEVYKALEKKFDLPPFSEETAEAIQNLGDRIGNAQFDRQKDILRQELSDLLAAKRGLKTSDAYTSWMYFSMLSGPGTQLVNIGANLTSMMGYIAVEAVKHPLRVPRMLGALMRTAIGKGQIEARESFFTGYALGKQGEKYYRKGNPAEIADAYFKSGYKTDSRLAKADQAFAKGVHKLLRGTKSYYIGRLLMAGDIFFYKINQEMAYTARMGKQTYTPQLWKQAMSAARTAMIADGQNPDDGRAMKRRQLILAHEFLEDRRLHDENGRLVNEREVAWRESSLEALDATFQQEPTGFLGVLSNHLEAFTRDKPIGKLLIPFTRVVANVANHMLEWTPYGFARYAFASFKQGSNPFILWEDGKLRKEVDIAIRAALGLGAMIAIMALAAESADDEDPEFAIYGDGPRDLNARRQLQQRGWKPNSIKVGNSYYSYLFTPLAMALSIVGRHMDDYRDGRIPSPTSVSLSSSAVALIESVKNQSFLASASDLMAAVDSPDPQGKVSRVFARIATIPLPNLFKQLDKVVDPSIQEATGFWETMVKEFPVARHSLKPAINVFGEAVERTPGLIRFPGMDRFITMQRTDDPVLNLIGGKRLVVPGFSKGTKLGDEPMTPEQYYEYVQIAGPRIKARISAEINSIESLPHDAAQDRIEKIATEEKAKARRLLKSR